MDIKESINRLLGHNHLDMQQAESVMNLIMDGQATPAQIAAYLISLRFNGETIEEIAGSVKAMRSHLSPVKTSRENVVDTCGTGGDHHGTFNISTISALITAAAGVPVAKHGNRSVSSKCGSADVLEKLGIHLSLTQEQAGKCLDMIGIVFLFAPGFHPAMKHAIGPRREIGARTIFNVMGPLTNPANSKRQLLGVYDRKLTGIMASVLKELGSEHVMVVHGRDGLDEITTTDITDVTELKDNEIKNYTINPEDHGIPRATLEDLAGGDADVNAGIVRDILSGGKGAKRDITLLNAGAAIMVGGKAKDIKEGITIAAQTIDSGAASKKLEEMVITTKKLATEN